MAQDLAFPFVTVPGLDNFRDVGGWHVEDKNGHDTSAVVRTGVFYRGPDPSSAEPAGLEKLKELRVNVAFDLRSKKQVERAGGVKELEGIARVPCPVFGDEESGPQKAALRYLQYSADGTAVCFCVSLSPATVAAEKS
jgi:Tyrosine phosphatase family